MLNRSALPAVALAQLLAAPAGAQYDSQPYATLTSPTGYDSSPQVLLLADLDGDGRDDALVTYVGSRIGLGWADAPGGLAPVTLLEHFIPITAMAAADLDQDGDQDVAYTFNGLDLSQSQTGLLVNEGPGSLSDRELGDDEQGNDLEFGDVNGDGDPDMLLAAASLDQIRTALGGPFASFGPFVGAPAGDEPVALTLGDVNADGDLDVALGRRVGAAVLLGDGRGGFGQPRLVDTGGHGVDVSLIDLDLDGQLDIAVATEPYVLHAEGWLSTARGLGNGLFEPAVQHDIGLEPVKLATADMDADGGVDLLASDTAALVALLRNDGAGGFDPPQVSIKLIGARAVGVDDRDGDGAPDLISVSKDAWLELRNDGAGRLQAPRAHLLAGLEPELSAFGDLDGDGALDAFVPGRNDGASAVLLGDGAGGFGPSTLWAMGSGPYDPALGDLDQDGDLDAVVAEVGLHSLVLAPNDGAGGFPTWVHVDLNTALAPRSPRLADLDGDGLVDVASVAASELLLSSGDGVGGISATTARSLGIPSSNGARALELADLDGDGDLDVVAGGTSAGDLALLLGDGQGQFVAQPPLTTASGCFDLTLADLDGDGHQDLVSLSTSADALFVFAGDGAGGFGPSTSVPTLDQPWRVNVADLDGDGVDDLLVSSSSQSLKGVALHRGQLGRGAGELVLQRTIQDVTAPRAADLTGDGLAELLLVSQFVDALVVHEGREPSAWAGLPGSVGGSGGVPLLDGSGSLAAGAPFRVSLSRVLPSSLTTFVLGADTLGAPFKGGLLAPDPLVLLPLPSDPWGFVVQDGVWPAGIPAGGTMVLQAWLPDDQATHGFAASDGVVGTTP